jgi:hypothetical protein
VTTASLDPLPLLHRSAVFLFLLLLLPAAAYSADWSGDIPNGTTWPSGVVQRVTATARVPAGSTLTIQAGAIVKFNYAVGLTIEGTLNASGTSSQPVILTSYRDDSAGGDIDGGGASSGAKGDVRPLSMTATSTANVLDHFGFLAVSGGWLG